jgi:hypothetical protein
MVAPLASMASVPSGEVQLSDPVGLSNAHLVIMSIQEQGDADVGIPLLSCLPCPLRPLPAHILATAHKTRQPSKDS